MPTDDALLPEHLLIAPLLIPFIAGALMLFYDDRRRWLKLGIGLVSVVALFFVSTELLNHAKGAASMRLYLLGNWPMPMGILLVVDRLSALMVMLTSLLALPALLYTAAGWQGKGQHYHSLFQFLLFGLNGAFLTGDLFNLFVFFEVMLAASYGLVLHGSGPERIKAGLHYIAINLAASLLFLLGVSLIYGVTGTLNMAELSRISADIGTTVAPGQRPLFEMGAAFLGLAFLVKAAVWPLGFWLPRTYAAAAPPAAAIMAIMSKVGAYAILRLAMLVFGHNSGASSGFGANVLIFLGIATMLFGMMGVLSARGLALKAGNIALISSGTIIAIVGFALAGGGARMLAGAIYYMAGSTMAVSALFLLAEPLERGLDGEEDSEAEDEPELVWGPMGFGAVEDDDAPATTLPASVAALGACFVALVGILAGFPPFSGFIGKFAMVSGMLVEEGPWGREPDLAVWGFIAALVVSGFAVLIALLRFGIRRFWINQGEGMRILVLEIAPVGLLLGMLVLMTVQAQPAMRYSLATARALLTPPAYAETVLTVTPVDPKAAAVPVGPPVAPPPADPQSVPAPGGALP